MKNYVYIKRIPLFVSNDAEEIYCSDFLNNCNVYKTIRNILLNNQDEIYFGRTKNMYFYVLDGIISCYR